MPQHVQTEYIRLLATRICFHQSRADTIDIASHHTDSLSPARKPPIIPQETVPKRTVA